MAGRCCTRSLTRERNSQSTPNGSDPNTRGRSCRSNGDTNTRQNSKHQQLHHECRSAHRMLLGVRSEAKTNNSRQMVCRQIESGLAAERSNEPQPSNRPTSRSTRAAGRAFSVIQPFWPPPGYLGRWAARTTNRNSDRSIVSPKLNCKTDMAARVFLHSYSRPESNRTCDRNGDNKKRNRIRCLDRPHSRPRR